MQVWNHDLNSYLISLDLKPMFFPLCKSSFCSNHLTKHLTSGCSVPSSSLSSNICHLSYLLKVAEDNEKITSETPHKCWFSFIAHLQIHQINLPVREFHPCYSELLKRAGRSGINVPICHSNSQIPLTGSDPLDSMCQCKICTADSLTTHRRDQALTCSLLQSVLPRFLCLSSI